MNAGSAAHKGKFHAAGLAVLLLFMAGPASGQTTTGCSDPTEADFNRVPILTGLNEPMETEMAPDGTLFVIEKVSGKLLMLKPGAAKPVVAATLQVSDAGNHADGLLGLELDPGFAQNKRIYLYYSPVGPTAVNVVSRFTISGDVLDLGSERRILEVKTHRSYCCHSSGDLEFGKDGNLYLSTGDNAGVTKGVVQVQAEATSGNSNDLRGKILRIRPLDFAQSEKPVPGPGSTYSIPAGNLFAPTTGDPAVSKTRPEILAMGLRNPFRFGIDAATGWVLAGDVGSDGADDKDEFNLIKAAANFGWPWFTGDNQAYLVGGRPADAAAPVNGNPANTGLATLPPARPPAFWYGYAGSEKFPAFGMGGRVACAGPRYRYDPGQTSPTRLPPAFDGKWFVWDWRQRWLRAAALDGNGAVTGFTDLFPAQIKSEAISRLTDVKIGPDGALYALQYGWVDYSPSTQGALFRFDWKRPECHVKTTGLRHAPGAAKASGRTRSLLPHASEGGWDVCDIRGRRVR